MSETYLYIMGMVNGFILGMIVRSNKWWGWIDIVWGYGIILQG